MNRADLRVYQGDDYSAVVTVKQEDTDPADVIAGYTAKAQIRAGYADCQSQVGVEIATSVDSPKITLMIPHDQTVLLDSDIEYVWDLQIVSPAGMVTTILSGNACVLPEVTR